MGRDELGKSEKDAVGYFHMEFAPEWWKTAFGKDYFEIFETIFPEPTETEAAFFQTLIPQGGTVLDLACGAGRHSVALSRMGFPVTGVDTSIDALSIAQKQADQNKVGAEFLEGDIRHLNIGRTFDLILLVGNALGYGTDLDQQHILSGVTSHLKPTGIFVIGLSNVLRTIGSLKDEGDRAHEIKVDGHTYRIREQYQFDPRTMMKTSTWTAEMDNKEQYRQQTRVRLYFFPELTSMLAQAGLEIINAFGSYQGQSFTVSSSHLILECKKAAHD